MRRKLAKLMPPDKVETIAECDFPVPYETASKLNRYVEILRKWNRTHNLVSRATESEVWRRHVVDSLQLLPLIGEQERVLDVGSGAGLPGLVLAVAGREVTMVERDAKKAAFLEIVAIELGVRVRVINDSVEKINGEYDVITARAVTTIHKFLHLIIHLKFARILLLKGRTHLEEIYEAKNSWNFQHHLVHSITDGAAKIVVISDVQGGKSGRGGSNTPNR